MSTLGDKLRGLGQPALAFEADKLTAQTEMERASSAYWYRTAKELEERLEQRVTKDLG